MVVVGPESLVFVEAKSACSCGKPADAQIVVHGVSLEKNAFGAFAVVRCEEAQCYVCRTCGLWALAESARRKRAA